jgi:hypothetical protein
VVKRSGRKLPTIRRSVATRLEIGNPKALAGGILERRPFDLHYVREKFTKRKHGFVIRISFHPASGLEHGEQS